MDQIKEQIAIALKKICSDVLNADKSDTPMANKYSFTFPTQKVIYSPELCQALKKHFNIEIPLEELNLLLPDICRTLGFPLEPMRKISDLANPIPFMYQIRFEDK